MEKSFELIKYRKLCIDIKIVISGLTVNAYVHYKSKLVKIRFLIQPSNKTKISKKSGKFFNNFPPRWEISHRFPTDFPPRWEIDGK